MRVAVRSLLTACLLSLGVWGTAAAAGFWRYTPEEFKAAVETGTPVLVEIDASWCPVCAKQRPIIYRLSNEDRFRNVKILVIDFDKQKDDVRHFGADSQSTLIAFKGGKEVGRAVGITDPDAIEALFQKAEG